jgi:hypothetical protein
MILYSHTPRPTLFKGRARPSAPMLRVVKRRESTLPKASVEDIGTGGGRKT